MTTYILQSTEEKEWTVDADSPVAAALKLKRGVEELDGMYTADIVINLKAV